MKVCLVYPDLMDFPSYFDKVGGIISVSRRFLPPLGILYLISNSSKKIDFIDNRITRYPDEGLYNKLKGFNIVGFGGTVTEVKQAKNVAKLLRESGVITIYGGANATLNYNQYTNNFDIIVRGEGEITFEEVLNALEKKRPLDNIPGIVHKKDGKIIHNSDRPFIQNLDILKYPAREIRDLKRYLWSKSVYLNVFPTVVPMNTVLSGRGCPYMCTFCSSKLMWKQIYRKRRVEAVVKEIEYLMENFETRSIYFREDLFTRPREWVLKFCNRVKPLNIEWMCESRVDTVDKEMLKVMRDAGCVAMWFGIESCSNKTLRLIKKGFTIEQAKRTIKNCNEVDVICGGNFMFGFPHETREDILFNFEEAQKLGLDWIAFSRLIGFPRSELYDLFRKERLDRYEYESIIVPDTRYMHADEVTDLGYSKFPEIINYNKSHKLK
ncbi:hypothetical protein AUJ66_03985 [Candidatus Desantisbacteria bacterium CG1_02_38_46]|uniref:Radical SAM core domain-containing protein n=1 Tax=Candidatus Desantisbacteria bacterium CG1_02_38_46 TaxID=1817893 RepID=A0A1J4SCW6_9BACT|nr:MAG: hypothetical protein AUJ66_03985 [Candidatus Desantisbacteria bacterium CG1_02_38_46]